MPRTSRAAGASAGRAAAAADRAAGPSLTERRKAATRMEIARAAAGLFMRNGLRATRAEDIATAAGVAPRTFYRYFASKEEALAPLFAAGARKWAATVRDAPAGLSVPDALQYAVTQTLTPGVGVPKESLDWVRSLLRLAEASPALRRVWAEECQTAERALAEVLAARASAAVTGEEAGTVTGATLPPELRLSAAVASAAVRVAVEAWASGDDAPDGPVGPAALAAHHLAALHDFLRSAA